MSQATEMSGLLEKKSYCIMVMIDYKQLLDEVFVISEIIKVEASEISRGRRPRLISLAEILIIRISQKPNSIIVLL